MVAQYKLGAKNAGTFDVGCACASFPTGLNIAAGLISTNPNLKYVMVIGAYMMHKLADWENDVMSFFYGDGAGAAILTATDKPGFVSSTFFATAPTTSTGASTPAALLNRPPRRALKLDAPR